MARQAKVPTPIRARKPNALVKRYDRCLYCQSMRLQRLDTHYGDPEGIRHDYLCLNCGGMIGTTKSNNVKLIGHEHESGVSFPHPDLVKVSGMQVIVKLDEFLHTDLTKDGSREALALSVIEPALRAAWEKMLLANAKLKIKVQNAAEELSL